MSKSTILEVPLSLDGAVRVEVFPNGDVRISGARQVKATYQVQPSPERDGDSREISVFVTPINGFASWQVSYVCGVEVIFEPVAGSYWASRGLAKPSFAAILQEDEQTIEISSIDCEGKEKHVLGVVPPRAALV